MKMHHKQEGTTISNGMTSLKNFKQTSSKARAQNAFRPKSRS